MNSPESKFIALSRHGELDNPTNIFYNRDSAMRPEDIIHISKAGRSQMKELGEAISKSRFTITRIYTSPQTRTKESSEELSKTLGGVEVVVDDDIDEAFAPGPYLEGMTMDKFVKDRVNVYDENTWRKYNHENPSGIIARMQRALMRITQELKNGETAVIMSHGDPVAWCLNSLNGGEIPQPKNLREMIYPTKGESFILKIETDNKISILHILPERKQRGSSY